MSKTFHTLDNFIRSDTFSNVKQTSLAYNFELFLFILHELFKIFFFSYDSWHIFIPKTDLKLFDTASWKVNFGRLQNSSIFLNLLLKLSQIFYLLKCCIIFHLPNIKDLKFFNEFPLRSQRYLSILNVSRFYKSDNFSRKHFVK